MRNNATIGIVKTCSKCCVTKPHSEFYKENTLDGYGPWCKSCKSEYSKSRYTTKTRKCLACGEMRRFHSKKHSYCLSCRKNRGYEANLERYGLSIEQYEELLRKQNGVCAICGKPESTKKRLSIDHDHSCCPGLKSCGKCIRGLLCFRCNAGLGNLDDSIRRLERALKYLREN
jgi:hypothetical protein